jgi:tetratricopeptide (TPR) repeat protein
MKRKPQLRTRRRPPSGSAASWTGPAKILADAGVPPQQIPSTLRKLIRALQAHHAGKQQGPAATLVPLTPRRPPVRDADEAAGHFARAFALEASDPDGAREAYAAALAVEKGHLEASINLGRLLHLSGELEAAERTYRAAKHASATLSFNLALLLEDLHRDEEAALAYQQALAQEPAMHEAHLHLSLLHERRERPREALMHLLAFRRKSQR